LTDGNTIQIDVSEDRFHRLRQIPWWDQSRLRASRALVLGAGALGNEIVKNLALVGVGTVTIVDFDRVENSNLSRSVLFTPGDEGRLKCDVAADAARRIYPGIHAQGLNTDIIFGLGWGWYLDADIVLTGLDGREARLAANRACIFAKRPLFDGAIEGIDGVVRTFCGWQGPCYECTMSERDWELIHRRRSCNLLSRDEMVGGHVPTTSTISSVVAALQVQQAVKHLHGLDVQAGRGIIFNGLAFEAHAVEYQKPDDCYAHEVPDTIELLPWSTLTVTALDALTEATRRLGDQAVLELRVDLVTERLCGQCGFRDSPLSGLLRLRQSDGLCPTCGDRLDLQTTRQVDATSPFVRETLARLGIPAFDIMTFRCGQRRWHVLLDGDRQQSIRSTGRVPALDGDHT